MLTTRGSAPLPRISVATATFWSCWGFRGRGVRMWVVVCAWCSRPRRGGSGHVVLSPPGE